MKIIMSNPVVAQMQQCLSVEVSTDKIEPPNCELLNNGGFD